MRSLWCAPLIVVGACALSLPGYAGPPVLFKGCTGVKAPSGVGLIVYDSTCTQGYVLPSAMGSLDVTAAFVNLSDNTCAAVKAMESAALGTFGGALDREKRRKELAGQLEAANSRILKTNTDLSTYQSIQKSLGTTVEVSETELSASKEQFSRECGGDATTSDSCFALATKIKKVEKRLAKAKEDKAKIDVLVGVKESELSATKDLASQITSALSALENAAVDGENQRLAQEQLTKLRKEQGGAFSATLQTSLQADVEKLRKANPNSPISFESMRFTGGSLFAAGIDREGNPEVIGGAELIIPGQAVDGGGTLFVNAGGAKLTLDVVAACQAFEYKRPDPDNLKAITQSIAANVVAKAYLKYKALLSVTVVVKMDYQKFYELIVSASSKNGFFKTSTVKNVAEKLVGSNDLSVSIVDEGNVLSAEAKDAIQVAMRDRVIQRAFDLLQAKYVGIDPSQAPSSAQAGAPVLAKELRKCPNPWCQAGAAVVDVAHAIFGGSSSTQTFVQNQNVASSETYTNAEAFEYITDMAFRAK